MNLELRLRKKFKQLSEEFEKPTLDLHSIIHIARDLLCAALGLKSK